MSKRGGFWSYVHADDSDESGRITQLGRDIVASYGLQTGDEVELFLDQQIQWGQDWESAIDQTLASVAFFIPVITPRYFESAQCRRELNFFAGRAQSLSVDELIMPVLYVQVADLLDEECADEAVRLVRRFQWEDWSDLRFEARDSGPYRRAVAKMASRIMAANRAADETVAAATSISVHGLGQSAPDELGLMDRLGILEEEMPNWSESMTGITEAVRRIGESARVATEKMTKANRQARPIAARLTIAKQLSSSLSQDASRLESLVTGFSSGLNKVDSGIRAAIELAELQSDPEDVDEVNRFMENIRYLATAAEDGLGAFASLATSIHPVENMSRDLRPPLQSIRRSATLMEEAREVTRSWLPLLDAFERGGL